jgi:hypothetical protein
VTCRWRPDLDQIEGAEHGGMVVAPGAQQVEGGEAPLVNHDCLTVDKAGLYRQAFDRLDDAQEAVGEVIAVATIEPHTVAIAASQGAEAVALGRALKIRRF